MKRKFSNLLVGCLVLFGVLSTVSAQAARSWSNDSYIKIDINSGNPAFPYPQFLEYKIGKTLAKYNPEGVTHADMEKTGREAYEIMSHRCRYDGGTHCGVPYITFNNFKKFGNDELPHGGAQFCTEGDGYMLLAAAIFADQATFNGLWMWIHDNRFSKVKKYSDGTWLRKGYEKNGRLVCKDPEGTLGLAGVYCTGDETLYPVGHGDTHSAADGDYDIAMALLIAHKQWGDTMKQNGKPVFDSEGNLISYKKIAQDFIKALVDTVPFYDANDGVLQGDGKAYDGFHGYLTGNIGVDGYPKGGNTWPEATNWRSTQTLFDQKLSIFPSMGGGGGGANYVDYSAPAYYNEFANWLENDDGEGTEWQITQFKRAEASSDWVMGQFYNSGAKVACAGRYSVSNNNDVTFTPYNAGEDFRYPWRTILNYLWHDNPETTWDPVTHTVKSGGNTFEHDMAMVHAEFLRKPIGRRGLDCDQLGMNPDPGQPYFFGPAHLVQSYLADGSVQEGGGTNFLLGCSAPAVVATGDLALIEDVYRQSELVWDDASEVSSLEMPYLTPPQSGITDDDRYINSMPKYFHGWFRCLGLLTHTGNLHAPRDMVSAANMKVYMSVDKTYAYVDDAIDYTVQYRNYGSADAKGVTIETEIDPNYEVVSISNGGKFSGGKIVWNIGTVSGFRSGHLAETIDSVTFRVVVKDTLNPRICLTSTISGSNFEDWVSNEYPNHATYTMERNCVDILANRSLEVKKSANRTAMNPNDLIKFTIEFENKSGGEESWLNGGRDNVRLTYGNFLPDGLNSEGDWSNTTFYQYYRFWHDGAEAYINMGNYRVSYFLNDINRGFYGPDNPNGWTFIIDNENDVAKYGYFPETGGAEILFQKIPAGEDENGRAWNQRFIVKFPNVLTPPCTHVFDKLNTAYLTHKGVYGPGLYRTALKTYNATNMKFKVADDWSYTPDLQIKALDGQKEYFVPITPGWYNPEEKQGVEINNISRYSCSPDQTGFDRVLVEEFDGYTWRRILGRGPLPGREAYDVVVIDTIPIELEWDSFIVDKALGVTATYIPAPANANYTGIVKWTVPEMLVGEKGKLVYQAIAKDIGCAKNPQPEDKYFKNVAWISSRTDSPDSSQVDLKITCNELPPVIDPQTSLFKVADKENAEVGDNVSYTVYFKNTEGTIIDGDFSSAQTWTALGGAKVPNVNGQISCDQNKNQGVRPPYFFTHEKAYGKDVTIETEWQGNDGDLYLVFRYNDGTPYGGDFDGICLKLSTNSGSKYVKFEVLEGNTVFATDKINKACPAKVDGTFSPMVLKVVIKDDKMYVYINEMETSLATYKGLSISNAGYVGIYSGPTGCERSLIRFHAEVDHAFDVRLYDQIPAELGNITDISHNGVYDETNRLITWPSVGDTPKTSLAPGDSIGYTFTAEVVSCDNYINNYGLATVYGLDTLKVLNTIECGVSCPIEKVTLTAAASEICEGDSVLLSATAEPAGNYEYEFFLDKVSLGAPSASDELYVKKKGSYTVKVYDATDISCNKESSKVEVTVDSIPPFSLGNDISLCSGGTAWIKTGLPTGYTYEWSNGAAEDSIEVNAAGEYSVKVSSSICEAFDTIQVTVADELEVDLGPDTTVCATSLPYILDATAIYDTYEWSDASTASTLEVTQSGEYTVKVTQGSCSGEGKVIVTVSEVEKLKGTFEVTYLVSDTTANGVFANNLTTQDAGVLEKVSDIQYTWMKADGTPLLEEPTPDVPAAVSSATETYKVYGVNADGCPTDTATINVTISGAPVPVVSDTSYCVGETSQALTATPSPSSDGATWTLQWYDANKSPLTAAPTPSTDASGETTYYVSQKSGNNESGLVLVTVKVYGAVTPDVSQNQLAYCLGDTYNNPTATVTANANTLQMQGTLEWKVGATAWDGVSPVDYASGDTKVSVVNKYEISASHVCVSDTASFTVSVTELAKPTGDLSVNYVKTEGASGTFPSLTDKNANVAVPSAGNQLIWYDAAGTKQTDTPTPQYDNNWVAGKDYELTYYVSQTDGTCESDTVTVKVTISDSPMPTAAPVSYCQNAPARALTASINTTVDGAEKYVLLWYTTATGGTAQDSIVPTTDLVGSTTYYVSQKHKDTNAESSRTSVVVTVHALPELVATTPAAQCGGNVDLSTLFNEKNNLSVKYDFYEDATTATALSSSAVTVGKTYYAEGYYEINTTATTTAVCRSVARTPVTVTIDDLSGLAIAGDATVCPNGTVELTASATSTSPGTITYSWDGGAASATSIYTTPVITGDFGSSHNFTVEAVAGACSETATHTVKIDRGIRDGAMTINGSAGNELRICGGETIELGTTHTGSNFAWYDMSGSPIQSGATLSVTPTQTTQYELRFENQCATSDTITIEVSSFSVSVDWTALNKTICTGEEAYATLSLTGYDPTASGAYIKWYKDGNELTAFANNSSLTIPQATLSDNGTYTYKVSNGACEKPDATTADAGTLTVLAPATYTKSADQVICAGESVLLEVTANETDAQLQWADGLTDASRSENPTQATTYQFTVNRSGYCAVTDSIVVDVRQLPITKITDNLLVCEGDAAELVGGATGDDLSGYYWIAPSGDTIGSGLKVRITPTEGGEYQFVVNSANCGSSASKLTLTLVERPKVGIDSLGIRDRRILVLSGGSGVFEFRIDEGEWSANDTYTNIPFMQHTAWVRDEVGCQGSALFVVTAPEIAIPEFFSPEGDGVNDEWDLSHIFDVYDQAEVTIYDRFGKELITFNGDVGSWDGTYNGHPMPSTDYWYVINIPEIDMIYTGHFTLIRK